jgi:hypothetical protein
MVFYNSNIRMQQLVRLIWALVYVPSDYIILAWETFILGKVKDVINNMEEDYNHELESFIKYVGEEQPYHSKGRSLPIHMNSGTSSRRW